MDDRNYISDEEARQPIRQLGEGIMRKLPSQLLIPGRTTMKGKVFVVQGEFRQFENQNTNTIELTTAAASRLKAEIRAHRNAMKAEAVSKGLTGTEVNEYANEHADDFEFVADLEDLTTRVDIGIGQPFGMARPSDYAPDPRYANPIVGLDVAEDGSALDVIDLVDDLEDLLTDIATATPSAAVPAGFIPATGGAFASDEEQRAIVLSGLAAKDSDES